MQVKKLLGERVFGKAFHKHSLLGDKKFFDPFVFPVAKELKDNFEEVQKEITDILKNYDNLVVFQDVSPNQAYIPKDDGWRMFFFKAMGIRFKRNERFAPKITEILSKYKDIQSAYISVLGPKSYLNPHKGPWSGILRMHLGAVIPGNNECTLLVEQEPYHWKEGELVLFDDTFDHMAINNTEQPRAILFLDIMRPLPQPWKFFNWMCRWVSLFTPYIISAYFKHKKWEERFYSKCK
jgi:ornithine lipid ester-linked acyl 2-hydroxylase